MEEINGTDIGIKAFRLSVLIAEKALRDGTTEARINNDLADCLGIKPSTFGHIRRTTDPSRVNANQLHIMAQYFGVSISDLINPAYMDSRKPSNVR